MTELLIQVTSPFFCAGAVFRDGRCVQVAPILRRALFGRNYDDAREFVIRRQWHWRVVPQHGRDPETT